LDNSVSDIKKKIKDILSQRQKVRVEASWKHPSGVLIPIYVEDGRYGIVLTRRSHLVHYHKGEIAFPGGGYHPSDGSLRQTALRESYEEIGLDPGQVEILGELDDTPTRVSGFIITPFVGLIPAGYPFKASDYEIGEVINIPVDDLLFKESCQTDPPALLDGNLVKQYVFTYQDKQVVGATARILKQFLEIYCQARVAV